MSQQESTYQIEVEGYRLYAYHGVFPEENKLGQEFEIDFRLTVLRPSSMKDDDIEQVISYWDVMRTIGAVFTENTYKLLETAAAEILEKLSVYPTIQHASVYVKKLAPPVPATVKTVGVRLEKSY